MLKLSIAKDVEAKQILRVYCRNQNQNHRVVTVKIN
jgi:hypothetical protein